MTRQGIISRRRAFRSPGFVSLAAVEMDGDWVSPIQKTSGSPTGPVLVGKHWFDADSVEPNRDVLDELGYLPTMPFNRVIDESLGRCALRRSSVYITQAFHLLPEGRGRSRHVPHREMVRCVEEVTRHELEDRAVIALGSEVQAALHDAGCKFIKCCHPSARLSREYKVSDLCEALGEALARPSRRLTARSRSPA